MNPRVLFVFALGLVCGTYLTAQQDAVCVLTVALAMQVFKGVRNGR